MNKLFFGLVTLTFVGMGVLFWLMKALPPDQATDQAPSQVTAPKVVEEPKEIVDEENHEAHDAKEGQEPAKSNADATQAQAEPAKEDEVSKLTVSTEPVQALVFVDGQMKGQTPLDLELGPMVQKLKLEAAGYNPVERDIPAVGEKDTAKSLAWTITLRASKGALHESPRKNLFETAKVEKPKVEKAKREARTIEKAKTASGFWIQLKSIPATDQTALDASVKALATSTGQTPTACKVNLGDKGLWYRVLLGPYSTRDEAGTQLSQMHSLLNDKTSFVVGDQKCL
jgi:hypothetical protein